MCHWVEQNTRKDPRRGAKADGSGVLTKQGHVRSGARQLFRFRRRKQEHRENPQDVRGKAEGGLVTGCPRSHRSRGNIVSQYKS